MSWCFTQEAQSRPWVEHQGGVLRLQEQELVYNLECALLPLKGLRHPTKSLFVSGALQGKREPTKCLGVGKDQPSSPSQEQTLSAWQ